MVVAGAVVAGAVSVTPITPPVAGADVIAGAVAGAVVAAIVVVSGIVVAVTDPVAGVPAGVDAAGAPDVGEVKGELVSVPPIRPLQRLAAVSPVSVGPL